MNKLPAVISKVEKQESLCFLELDASGIPLSMLMFDLKPSFTEGRKVYVLFKETEVVLARHLCGDISLSNRFQAVVTAVNKGALLADVTLSCRAGEFCSIVTMQAVERLGLKTNDEVTVLMTASQLSLEMSHDT